MLLFVLAFLGGVLTILSTCILPVLPFVFTRAGEPFRRSGLPLLIGMAVTFVALGNRLSSSASRSEGSPGSSLLLGVATGLLWAPCAGPILGLILTGAALQGASAKTVVLLIAYAAGSATSLAIALVAGGRFLGAMKRSLGFD